MLNVVDDYYKEKTLIDFFNENFFILSNVKNEEIKVVKIMRDDFRFAIKKKDEDRVLSQFEVYTEEERNDMAFNILSDEALTSDYQFAVSELHTIFGIEKEEMESILVAQKIVNPTGFTWVGVSNGEIGGFINGNHLLPIVKETIGKKVFLQRYFDLLKSEERFGEVLSSYDSNEYFFNGLYIYRIT